jgi:hypothetical protein
MALTINVERLEEIASYLERGAVVLSFHKAARDLRRFAVEHPALRLELQKAEDALRVEQERDQATGR